MAKKKERTHREWFRTVMDRRMSCPRCHAKLPPGESVWSWGEYVIGKWRTVTHFCKECFPDIQKELVDHAKGCGCQFELVGYQRTSLPDWLTLSCPSVKPKRGMTADMILIDEVNNGTTNTGS